MVALILYDFVSKPSFHGYIHIWGMWLFVKCMNLLPIASQVAQWLKNPPGIAGDAGDTGLTPGPGRSPGVGDGNPLRYSCLENSVDRGACWATVHGLAESQTWLSNWSRMHTRVFVKCMNLPCLFFNISTFNKDWRQKKKKIEGSWHYCNIFFQKVNKKWGAIEAIRKAISEIFCFSHHSWGQMTTLHCYLNIRPFDNNLDIIFQCFLFITEKCSLRQF